MQAPVVKFWHHNTPGVVQDEFIPGQRVHPVGEAPTESGLDILSQKRYRGLVTVRKIVFHI